MDQERQRATQYMEQLQRRVYAGLGIIPTDHNSDQVKSFQEEFVRKFYDETGGAEPGQSFEEFRRYYLDMFQKAIALTPTPYEEPEWYSLLTDMTSKIEELLKRRAISLDNFPLFGTLPTGRINAMAVAVPHSIHYLILFESGLFGFANLTAKAVVRAFPFQSEDDRKVSFSTKEDDWRQEVKSSPEIIHRFLDVLLAYLVGGNPHKAKPYLLDRKYLNFAGILRESMEYFVLAHEYGHIVKGHFSASNTKKAFPEFGEADELLTSWVQEFEADTFGLEIMLGIMMQEGFDLSSSFWGADFLFGCIEVIERAAAILRYGRLEETLSTTHPPTTLRRMALQEILKNSVPAETAVAPLGLSDIVYNILQYFWELCEPTLIKLHQDGIQLAPAWRLT